MRADQRASECMPTLSGSTIQAAKTMPLASAPAIASMQLYRCERAEEAAALIG
ncbi:MAG: hypothetical protein V4614_03310 [Pseudomonadota bacterium]